MEENGEMIVTNLGNAFRAQPHKVHRSRGAVAIQGLCQGQDSREKKIDQADAKRHPLCSKAPGSRRTITHSLLTECTYKMLTKFISKHFKLTPMFWKISKVSMAAMTTTVVFLGIAAVVAVLILTSLDTWNPPTLQSSQAQTNEQSGEAINTIRGPTAFLFAGGRSAIIVVAEPTKIDLPRGESIDVTLNIEHMVGNNGFGSLTLVPAGSRGSLILPSSVQDLTPEERTELMKQSRPIPGTIPLSSIVSYSDPQVTLGAGETKSIRMTIAIPKDLPDEMVQKSIHISPNLVILEMQNAEPDRASDALVYSDMVTVTVVG